MIVDWIQDPYPVWDKIRNRLQDDNKKLPTEGQFIGVFDGEMVGAFQLKVWNVHCYEIHGGIVPERFGQGPQICDALGRALFSNTPCLKIVACIPEFNRLMRSCAQKVGMVQEGIVKQAFLKWYRLHDLYIYGIRKKDVKGDRLCPQQ
jgi:RimJ/RimL family protein N-acetyltransferase